MAQLDQTVPGDRPRHVRWRMVFAGPSAWQVAAMLLVAAALASFFPLRFTATATLAFETGTQPSAAAVRAVSQLLASREMAQDAVRRLGPRDAGRIGVQFGWGSGTDDLSAAARAAWRLMDSVEVVSTNGGRDLSISLSAPTPALATRAAESYVAAFLALDGTARATDSGLTPIRRGAPAAAALLPDGPRPLLLGLLAAATLVLIIARRHASRPSAPAGRVESGELPVELEALHRIAWLGAPGAGLEETDVAARLAAFTGPPGGACQLILLTSEAMPDASARCAIAFARRLSDDARVALVALDAKAESLSALVGDPRAPGMSEMLFGVAGFGETIHRDTKSRAHVIPPGRDTLTAAAIMGADRLLLVLEALRRTYDYVVVAAPDLSAAEGAGRLAEFGPLVVFLAPDTAPETSSVESFDALAGRNFRRVLMLRLAQAGTPQDDVLPAPTLDAEHADTAWPLWRGAA